MLFSPNYWLLLSSLVLLCTPLWAFQSTADAPYDEKGSRFKELLATPRHLRKMKKADADFGRIEQVNYGLHKRQYIYFFRPDSTCQRAKNELIFFIHGGAWHVGKPEQHFHLASQLARQGYTVALPAYRLGPKFCYEDMQLDINTALLLALEHSKIEKSAQAKVVVGGASAGGNLAALLCFDNERIEQLGLNPQLIKGFFAFAGALDLSKMKESIAISNYAGKPETVTFPMANPIHYIDKKDQFSSLIFHGTADGMVDYVSCKSFIDKMEAEELAYEFYCLKGKNHLETTAKWYYDEDMDEGQEVILLKWLELL